MQQTISIRPFIGSQNFELSRNFYRDLGFEETRLDPKLSVFKTDAIAFYLQDAFVKDWIDNTMVFVEVADVHAFWQQLSAIDLSEYETARLVPIREENWGSEFFMHDPSGILWHFGSFKK